MSKKALFTLRDWKKHWQDIGRRGYNKPFRVPRSVPTDRFLVHNHIAHTYDMPHGLNGFRCWTQTTTKYLVRCRCGWSGLPHYRVRGPGSDRSIPGNLASLFNRGQDETNATAKACD